MTTAPDDDYKIIGDGEAASIALAKEYNGVIASNNLKDIAYYISKYNLSTIASQPVISNIINTNIILNIFFMFFLLSI